MQLAKRGHHGLPIGPLGQQHVAVIVHRLRIAFVAPVEHIDDAVEDFGGTDLIRSSVSFVLPDSVENIILLGSAVGATGNGSALDVPKPVAFPAAYPGVIAVGAFFGSGVGAWATTAIGRPILHVGLAIMAGGILTSIAGGFIGSAIAPKALGRPYVKER
mgnify:CR=1 FL=1